MKIGIPREIKTGERRVSLTPAGVSELVENGHTVFVEQNAGVGSRILDEAYQNAGATILDTPEELWSTADMIVKVKEPVDPEFDRMKEGQILFTYLHLAADRQLTEKLLFRKVIGIAYETIQLSDGSLPLLAPMSQVAGRLAVQAGCYCLEEKNGGKGLLLSGVPGVAPARVTIIGGGTAGVNAAHLAVGMGAQVTILDLNIQRLEYLEDIFHSRVVTLMSNRSNLEEAILGADLVIGAVLITGARAQKLIKKEYLEQMEPGSAIVDIAIDQGGCAETSRPTSHEKPTFLEDGIVHYCVTNMPGAVPRTSTFAITNATMPYVLRLANKGVAGALGQDPAFAKGLNIYKGRITYKAVADAVDMAFDCQTF